MVRTHTPSQGWEVVRTHTDTTTGLGGGQNTHRHHHRAGRWSEHTHHHRAGRWSEHRHHHRAGRWSEHTHHHRAGRWSEHTQTPPQGWEVVRTHTDTTTGLGGGQNTHTTTNIKQTGALAWLLREKAMAVSASVLIPKS